MTDSDDDAVQSEELPDSLLETVDSLTGTELEALLTYVENRIESDWAPLRSDIEASAAGEVLDVTRDGPYALVRAHPPADGDRDQTGESRDETDDDSRETDGAADQMDEVVVDTDVVSLYHVRREFLSDGTESLHWTYLGDVYDPEQRRCDACGRRLDETATVCPHCGSDEIHDRETDDNT